MSYRKIGGFFLWSAIVTASVTGCAKSGATAAPVSTVQTGDEPEFVIGRFEVPAIATEKPPLPSYLGPGGATVECFEPIKKSSTWNTEAERVRNLIQENERAVTDGVLRALAETFPAQKELFTNPAQWTARIDTPMVRHVFPAELRFIEDAVCVEGNLTFPLGARTVTTAFGASEITFVSTTPVPSKPLRALRQAALQRKMRVVIKNAYTEAVDDNGKPVRGAKNEKLYNSPSGTLIRAKEVPLPRDREVLEWKLIRQEPLFFAVGDLPSDGWRTPGIEETCEVFLVNYDAVPRAASCDALKSFGFGVEPAGAGKVRLKATDGSSASIREIEMGEEIDLFIGSAVLRILTSPVEEGVRLSIRYLLLDMDRPSAPPSAFSAAETKGGRKKGKSRKRAD